MSYLSNENQRFQSRHKTTKSLKLRKITGKGVGAVGINQLTKNLVATVDLIVTTREKLVVEELLW